VQDIVGKPPEWFHYDQDAQIRFKSRENPFDGDPFIAKKYLVARQGASYHNPYGFADLSMCFWPTLFKRNGLKFWVTFTEKFGMPWVIGKQPRGTDKATQNQLLDQLEAMVQDAIAVIPDDASVDTLKTDRQASADIYDKLLMYCRSEIAVALLGQNQSTEATANLASAQAAQEVLGDIRDGDARIIESTFNELFRWITDLNDGEFSTAPKFELYEESEVSKDTAERDKTLVDAGVKFTPAYWQRVYNLSDKDIDTTPAPAPVMAPAAQPNARPNATQTASGAAPITTPATAFAEPNAQATQDTLTADLARAGDRVLSDWMLKIQGIVNLAESPEDLSAKLLDAWGDLPTEKLQEVMALAFACADLIGRFDVAKSAPNA
jgi:phage gp29-like protein